MVIGFNILVMIYPSDHEKIEEVEKRIECEKIEEVEKRIECEKIGRVKKKSEKSKEKKSDR